MIISETQKPQREYYGVVEWERTLDPWHEDAFPAEYKSAIRSITQPGPRKSGWMGIDWCGNPIMFIPDGYDEPEGGKL
jgi:hypothetical protein